MLDRVYPFSWGVGEKFRSSQGNALDIRGTYALDKRAGQIDTLGSVVTLTGAGRVIDKYAVGADVDTTYVVSDPNSVIDIVTLSGDRVYTLSHTNAGAGDKLSALHRAGANYVTVKDASGAVLLVLGGLARNGDSAWGDFLFNGAAWVLQRSSKGRPALADLTALANIVAPTDGQAHLVRNYGSYVFTTTTSYSTALPPDDVAAADATPGFWRRAGRTRRALFRSITLTDFLVAYDTNSTLITRDCGAIFFREARFYRQSGVTPFAITLVQVAEVLSGSIILPISTQDSNIITGPTGKTYGLQWCVDKLLSQGATIFGASFGVWPTVGRAGFPDMLLFSGGLFRCPRYPGSSTTPALQPLNSAYTGGFVQDTSPNLAAYETKHQIAYVCNQNNVVDLDSYTYYAQFWNEAGGANVLANNAVMNVTLSLHDHTDETAGGD